METERDTKRARLHTLVTEPRDLTLIDEESITKCRRSFVNRNLKMKNIRTIGFDLDHTLAIYAKTPIESLAFDETKKKLVANKGYPADVLDVHYDPEFVIRGLVVDKSKGNIIKMDKREMSRVERKATYANKRLTIYDADYRSIDTLFSLPEVDLFAQIIDLVELKGLPLNIPFSQIFDDIRVCIDQAHQDGSIKDQVLAHPDRYLLKDPKLPLTLDKFLKGGKKLFLLTNSGLDYTHALLSYLLSGELDDYPDWKDYFDVVIIDANKPQFFSGGGPLIPVDLSASGGLRRHRVFRHGSSSQLEDLINIRGEEILYFGDHTHADILKSKKTSGWRTAMIIEELEREVVSTEKVKLLMDELIQLDELTNELRLQSHVLEEKVSTLKDTKSQDYNSLSDEEFKAIDKEIESYLRRVIRLEQKITENLSRTKELEGQVETAYNPYWGQLFKAGRENSRFGDQVEDFACVYTSRVSNFLHYPVKKYYQTAREVMPHEA
jgi:5'-nucleotidase